MFQASKLSVSLFLLFLGNFAIVGAVFATAGKGCGITTPFTPLKKPSVGRNNQENEGCVVVKNSEWDQSQFRQTLLGMYKKDNDIKPEVESHSGDYAKLLMG